MLQRLRDSRTHALRGIIGETSDRRLRSSPVAKEIEKLAGNRSGGDGESYGEIMEKQPTVLPIGEQAFSPPQLNRPLPHLFRPTQYACRNSVRRVPPALLQSMRDKWHRSERLLCVFQVQGHFLVGLVEFVDMRNGFSYAWMLCLWFSFRHCYPFFEQRSP
jgi:hypothetical protein